MRPAENWMELSSGRPGSILNVDMSDTEEVNRSETIAETDLSGRQLGGYRDVAVWDQALSELTADFAQNRRDDLQPGHF